MISPVSNSPLNTRIGFSQARVSIRDLHLTPDFDRARSKEASPKTKVASAIGAIAGTLVGVACCAKKQKKALLNVEYSLKEMLGVAFGAICGGVVGGICTTPRKKHERKIDEGIFQYSMVALPGVAVSAALAGCERVNMLKNRPAKIVASVLALSAGMKVAVDVANVVSDLENNDPDRKLKFKDAVASVDDVIGVLLLAKIKAVKKMKLDKVLPLVYSYCGYKAGTTN